ncbi:MAG: hypothetical protein HQM16_00790 [Deltaproteobacteria bacterium]|nr:hypothetical protein [Deltaproteobacteria bacterium]
MCNQATRQVIKVRKDNAMISDIKIGAGNRPDFAAYKADSKYATLIDDYISSRGRENKLYSGNYKMQNPLLDSNNNPIDFDGERSGAGWGCHNIGNGVSKDAVGEVAAAKLTAESTINASLIESEAMLKSSALEAEAAVTAALVDGESRCYEADQNLQAVKVQAETDLDIAKMEKEVEMEKIKVEFEKLEVERERIEKVDVLHAQAAVSAARAEETEADGKRAKAYAKADSYAYGPSGSSGWF